MKKLFSALSLLICTLFNLTGCVIIEQDFPELPNTFTSLNEDWKTMTLQTLTGEDDLTISRKLQNPDSLIISNPDYNKSFLIVVLMKTDCEKSQEMLPYLNEIASRIIPNLHDMNYVPVFLDIYEDSTTENISWTNNINNMDLFMNAATVCSDNDCRDLFLPNLSDPASGSVYVIDTHDISKAQKVYSWDLTLDPLTQSNIMEAKIAEAVGLDEITYNPSTSDWEDENL